MECHSSSKIVCTEWDLAVIVVLKLGFGPGHVDKRFMLEKKCGPGQVVKRLSFYGSSG